MTEAQSTAFTAASHVAPSVLHHLFVGAFIALLILWAGWAFVHVYRGFAAGKLSGQALSRFVIRVVMLIIISLYLFAS